MDDEPQDEQDAKEETHRAEEIHDPYFIQRRAEPADTMSADTNDNADATTAMTNLFIMPLAMRTVLRMDRRYIRLPTRFFSPA